MTTKTELNILIIDDDVGAARALNRLLRACGHIAQVSYSVCEAVELACRIQPDLILLDLAMPVIDGYEGARRLREMPSLSRTVLIACSGSVDEKKARAAGFDGWLVKPISDGDLDAVLALVLERACQSPANSEDNSGSAAAK